MSEHPITQSQCERNKEDCYENNIKPILDKLNEMSDKLDIVMPTVVEINNVRNAWNIGSVFGGWIVKSVIGISVILTAIYALKEWIKK